jgi:hypothetical protein
MQPVGSRGPRPPSAVAPGTHGVAGQTPASLGARYDTRHAGSVARSKWYVPLGMTWACASDEIAELAAP